MFAFSLVLNSLIVVNTLFVWSVRFVKYRVANIKGQRFFTIGDVLWVCLLSFIFAIIVFKQFLAVFVFLSIMYFFLLFILITDAIFTECFGTEVNWQSLRQFIKYRRELADSTISIYKFYCSRLPIVIIGALCFISLCALYFRFKVGLSICLILILVLTLLTVTKTRLNLKTSLLWILSTLLIISLSIVYSGSRLILDLVNIFAAPYLSWLIVGGALFGYCCKRFFNTSFFCSSSLINNILSPCPIKPDQLVDIRKDDEEAIINVKSYDQSQSSFFASIKDAHVFVVTLESVSAAYLNDAKQVSDYLGNSASSLMPFYESIRSRGWVSDYHVCSCPNTNSSFHDLFLGGYYNDESADFKQTYPKILQENGYEIAYSSGYVDEKDYICKYGLQNFLDAGSRNKTDCNELDWFSESLMNYCKSNRDKKLYLHIKNMQTHAPYHLYHHKNVKNITDKQRYLLACNESDAMVQSLYARLQKALDTDDILLVYSADHGQSFGEFDYFIHSSSVVRQQTQVPFAIYHPKLSARKISHSSHFDLFPTILDLLGIEYAKKNTGVTLGLDEVPFSHILYSETRRGNLSSCFGHVDKDRKLYFDLVYGRFFEMDLSDNIVSVLSGDRLIYYKQVMLRALEQRGLVGRHI